MIHMTHPIGPPRPRVDDSEIARLLLAHIFAKVPGKPVVRTFGATAQEVEAFLAEAPQGADIVVLDQYLGRGAVLPRPAFCRHPPF